MLMKLSLLVSAIVLLAACGDTGSDEELIDTEIVGVAESALWVHCQSSCGDLYTTHPVERVCDASCGDTKYCGIYGNAYTCESNNTADFWQCGVWKCDAGYHAVGYVYAQSCAVSSGTNENSTHCQENAGDFWKCSASGGSCPSGWHFAGKQCNAASACGACSTAGGWNPPINEIYCVKN
ncbi:MAG TPA: hypothetical protein VE093_41620 [Polyangiaceae bacterium]|nr:hypothetical protein [Polyangiaceae bacterium]